MQRLLHEAKFTCSGNNSSRKKLPEPKTRSIKAMFVMQLRLEVNTRKIKVKEPSQIRNSKSSHIRSGLSKWSLTKGPWHTLN